MADILAMWSIRYGKDGLSGLPTALRLWLDTTCHGGGRKTNVHYTGI